MTTKLQQVTPVTSMADEFPESLPSFEDSNDILDEEPVVPEAFRVKDEDSANWVLRHINEAKARAARAKAFAAKEQERAKREEDFFVRRFGPELEAWAKQNLPAKKKSISLPAGTVGFRKQAEHLAVDDDAALLAWAKQAHPELVVTTVKEVVDKGDLQRLFKTKGEVPPDEAAHIEPETEAFYWK